MAEASPVTVLPDGRKRILRRWEVIGDFTVPALIEDALFVPEGTFDGSLNSAPGSLSCFPITPQGTPSRFYPEAQLIGQALDGIKGVNGKGVLTQTYEELPAFPTETDAPSADDMKNTLQAITVIPTTGSMTINTPTLTVAALHNFAVGCAVQVAGAIAASPVVTILAIDSTGLVWTLSANATATVSGAAVAGVSTTVDGLTVVGYIRNAQEFTMKLIVAGIGNQSQFAVAQSAPYFATLPTGVRQRYFIAQKVEQHGTVFANITRTYRELPDDRIYQRWIKFSYPGSSGVNNFPPVTRETLATITEHYSTFDQGPSTLQYIPIYWQTITTTYTAADSGDTGTFSQTMEGYLNNAYDVTTTADVVFNGIQCSGLVSVGSSRYFNGTTNVDGLPSGNLIVESQVEYWNGNKRMGEIGAMCRRTNTVVTF